MEHPDLAQLAAVGGAVGSVLVLLARGRLVLLAGLVVLAVSEAGLAYSLGTGSLDRIDGVTGAAAAAVGIIALGAAAALLARRPAIVPVAVLVAAPFRPPLSFDSGGTFLVSIADDGRLGRLLPLYFVLAAAGAALGWRALRGRELRAVAVRDRRPRRRVLRLRLPLPDLGGRPRGRSQPARLLHAPVRTPARHRGARRLPRQRPARARGGRARRSARCSRSSGSGRPRRTSCSSTRPTSRSRTPTRTSSA